jgi:septum site-determining protein MinD
MTRIIAVHSHGGGTGKSNFAANIAALMALGGATVCLVDTDIQSPGLHVLFGLTEEDMPCALSDYLRGSCEIDQAVCDVTDRLGPSATGRLLLVPSRPHAGAIAQIVGRGYDAGLLDEAFRTLVETRRPDVLILDTHSGMTNETMVALARADALTIVMRPDEQEYQGAGVTVAVTRRLSCPQTVVVVNMTVSGADRAHIVEQAELAYGCEVAAVIPYSTDIAALAGRNVFILEHPDHLLSAEFSRIADQLLAGVEDAGLALR